MNYVPLLLNLPVFAALLLTRFKPRVGCLSERAAAQALGYTQASWDNLSGNEAEPASADKLWSALSKKEKEAVLVLGYSQLAWDNPWPAAGDKYFAQLTAAEKKAAQELGYNAKSWDNESGNEPQPAANDKGWSEFSNKERAAATVLGYTEFTWDNNPPAMPASEEKSFADLTTECGENATVPHPSEHP